MNVFDLANFTPVPTTQQMQCLKDKGYEGAFVGSSFGNVWEQQCAALEGFGFFVGEYMFPGRVHDTDREWWLDVETCPGLVINQATVTAAINQATNKPRGIYANRTSWLDQIGWDWPIKDTFPWLLCWDANYGNPPRPFIPFGGFTIEDRIISQWAGSVEICGLNLDLNIREEDELEFTDKNKQDIAEIVRAELLKALGTMPSTDPQSSGELYKKNVGEIVKLQAELLRQDMEATGQLKPRHP